MNNLQDILKQLLYTFWILFYVKLLVFNDIQYYINPVLNIFSWIMFVFILSFWFLSVFNLLKGKKLQFKKIYLIYFIPFFMLLGLESSVLGNRSLERKSSLVNSKSVSNANKGDRNDSEKKTEQSAEAGLINIVSPQKFAEYLDKIYSPSKKYYNKEFVIKGLFFKDKEACLDNQAVIGRYVLTCCAADAVFTGYVVEFKQKPALKKGEWFEVNAVLKKKQTKIGKIPVFEVNTFKKVKEDATPYIYPTFNK